MAQLTPDSDPATSRPPSQQVPEPEFPTKTPAGRRSRIPEAPGGQPGSTPVIPTPVIPNPAIPNQAAAAQALCGHFLANADRGDHAANDELVTELLRRIRARQAACDSAGMQPPIPRG